MHHRRFSILPALLCTVTLLTACTPAPDLPLQTPEHSTEAPTEPAPEVTFPVPPKK